MTENEPSIAFDTSHRVIELPGHLSLTGCEWLLRAADERKAALLVQRYGLPEIVARILAARGIAEDDVEDFLNPSLKSQLPDPFHLKDMDKAADRIVRAIQNKETIAIWGDYDVDGATSSAVLSQFFQSIGVTPLVYIPDRMTEGYGPNTAGLLKLKEQGAHVAITVDCGTLAFEPLAAAADAGLDVIVIDHHQAEAKLPRAVAVVNPNRLDEDSPHGHMAAVGVSFLLAVAVNSRLRTSGFYEEARPAGRVSPELRPMEFSAENFGGNKIPPPNLMQWLDMVALGTVCDVVPLTGVNRAFVAQGLKVMAARQNLGIRTLLDIAGIDQPPGVFHAGFVLGPRINAGGRVGKSDLGVRLLTCGDDTIAKQLALQLDTHNSERKTIESMVLEEAMAKAEQQLDQLVLLVEGENWHPGVIGIVAGRLKEAFNKPTAVIAMENGVGKASARSVSGFDIGSAVIAACESGLLVAGGGHSMAAGFTVESGKLVAFKEFMAQRAAKHQELLTRNRVIRLDAELHIGGITDELIEKLEQIGPFGQGNPSIRVVLRGVVNMKPEYIGKDQSHIRTYVKDPSGGASLSAIAFRSVGTKLGEALLATRGQTVDLVGQMRSNEWQGRRSVSLHIEDIAQTK
ncbi:MAG: single-stranded-DNA-specific exonuclease RecJ [Alphaproteobacteria bacterium]